MMHLEVPFCIQKFDRLFSILFSRSLGTDWTVSIAQVSWRTLKKNLLDPNHSERRFFHGGVGG